MPTAHLEQVAKATHRGGVEVTAHRRRAAASGGSALILQVKVEDEAAGGGASEGDMTNWRVVASGLEHFVFSLSQPKV